MITAVDHIDLKVPHLVTMVAFLELLGFDIVRDDGDSVELALPGGSQVRFEVREDPALAAVTIDHIALRADGPSALDRLKARGIQFEREKATIARTGRTVSNFRDPAGGKWQLAE